MTLTIFTPTYNRAHLLPRLYDSLCRQSAQSEFEWLVVDDGSTDGTEGLFSAWMAETNGFEIRYYQQPNGGKHRAINRAVGLARGEFFLIVDSDDYLTDHAAELALKWCESAREEEGLAGVAGLKITSDGETIGGDPKISQNGFIDATNLERWKYGLDGDKAEAYRTKLLARFPFPEFEGEKFVTEATVWDAIAAAGYSLRWMNEPIMVCEYLEEGLTLSGIGGLKGQLENPRGHLNYLNQGLRTGNLRRRKWFIRQYIIFIHHYGRRLREQGKSKKQIAQELSVPCWVCRAVEMRCRLRELVKK